MRRLISISLLLLFSLSLVSPLFAMSTADANIPACCRRDGQHHCIMLAAIAQHSTQEASASLQGRCPYDIAVHTAMNLPFVPDEIGAAISTRIVYTSANFTQAEAPVCISFNRSHQKRGPPSLFPSQS